MKRAAGSKVVNSSLCVNSLLHYVCTPTRLFGLEMFVAVILNENKMYFILGRSPECNLNIYTLYTHQKCKKDNLALDLYPFVSTRKCQCPTGHLTDWNAVHPRF